MNSDSNRVRLSHLKDLYRYELFSFLENCEGNKALIWDDSLTNPVALLCEHSELQARDVVRMFSLSIQDLPANTANNTYNHIIFLVRPELIVMETIASLISREDRYLDGQSDRQYHILFMPSKSEACCKKLSDKGVIGSFTHLESFGAHLLPLDTDLLSMNNPSFVRECVVENDFSCLHDVASSIMTLQSIFGVIPKVFSKGECSKRVLNIMMRMRREQAGSEEQITPQIDNLILLDRTVDLLTPFLSQLTYEGFIDEIFHIKLNSIKVPADRLPSTNEQSSSPGDTKKINLTSSDQLFSELRDKNYNAVGPILSSRAKAVSAKYEERNHAKTIGELKQFVSQLPVMQSEKQSITTNTTIAQMIKEYIATESFKDGLLCQQELRSGLDVDKINVYIDDCISRMEPIHKILRLIAIQSQCANGLKPQVLQYYKTSLIQVYGYQSIVLLNNMENAGFIKLQNPYTNKVYSTLRKNLNLVLEDINEQNPSDIAYVYSGYAPISVRLIQSVSKSGWKSISSSLQLLPGEAIEEVQQLPDGVRKRRGSITSSNSATSLQGERKVTLVYFLGGVTYAEISALRFLQQDDHPTDYIIATSNIINGDTFIDSLQSI